MKALIAILLTFVFANVAEAKHYRHHQHHYRSHQTAPVRYYEPKGHQTEVAQNQFMPHPGGCPRSLFCGCGTAVHLLGAPVRSLWAAASWFKFPRAAPAPGMAAVRSHHVFAIEQVLGNGKVLAYDPNSGGGKTRLHVRSLAGYTVVNPHGGKGA